MIKKDDLIPILRKEFETTKKVMRAYPEDKFYFRPHERSSDARKLMSTFVFEMYLLKSNILGEKIETSRYAEYKPEGVTAVLSDFENESNETLAHIETMTDEELSKQISFAGKEYTGQEFILMMLFDQIHHRGQLSVYVRLAGGKVPSIYGPSADDTSTNL